MPIFRYFFAAILFTTVLSNAQSAAVNEDELLRIVTCQSDKSKTDLLESKFIKQNPEHYGLAPDHNTGLFLPKASLGVRGLSVKAYGSTVSIEGSPGLFLAASFDEVQKEWTKLLGAAPIGQSTSDVRISVWTGSKGSPMLFDLSNPDTQRIYRHTFSDFPDGISALVYCSDKRVK